MRITVTSDLHGARPKVNSGDILIVAGDLTAFGSVNETQEFEAWLSWQDFNYKICIAGNHDRCLEQDQSLVFPLTYKNKELISLNHSSYEDSTKTIYLQDTKLIVKGGVTIYGSPWTPTFMNWYFMKDRGESIRKMWDNIPYGLDVLVTHGPPYGILDRNSQGIHCGCEELLKAVKEKKPKYHVFGHIHEGYGEVIVDGTTFINASHMTGMYNPKNKPVTFEV